MPFGLKNAGATYQRLVDTIFEGQMGRNLEAYMDDMVIKSKTELEMIKDIDETLLTLKKVNMKLNPKKCSFGIEEGKFLGYIVTSEGIRANPEKENAIVNMPSPTNLKQMQRLSGKLAALNKFLSKAAKKALPFLDTLKRSELPTLTAPKREEELMVYLSAATEAVSTVLLVERQGKQAPIHYVSRMLQGAEINYPLMEKLVLALVHAARWFRRYFQGHTIKVITDKPISQILNNREATGRLAKWGIELKAYGIKYALRSMIKGQVLTDFLADIMAEDNSTQIKASGPNDTLAEGKTSNEQRSRACLILIDPEGAEYSYALRLNFTNSNNDADYEVLLTSLRKAAKMKVEKMHAFVDSKLVASQVKGSYEAKGEKTKKYKEKALEMIHSFNNSQISHIPREDNKRADALSKLAAVQC
ncbi:reverse transcriptase domain-containing protein [Tanacetum coccineum]